MKRILVVDDDRAMAATLCDVLRLHGWETTREHDGKAAVELLGEEPLDLVLMDVVMPRMNGVEALREIRARAPDARVVLMTAYAADELMAEAREAGVYQIVAKPLQLPNLIELLEDAVRKAAG